MLLAIVSVVSCCFVICCLLSWFDFGCVPCYVIHCCLLITIVVFFSNCCLLLLLLSKVTYCLLLLLSSWSSSSSLLLISAIVSYRDLMFLLIVAYCFLLSVLAEGILHIVSNIVIVLSRWASCSDHV